MASVQELEVVEDQINPGRKMMTRPVKFLNRTLHRMAELCADQCIAGSLADSNKNVGYPGYYDRKEYNDFLASFEAEVGFLKSQYTEDEAAGVEPVPNGQLDTVLTVLVPSSYEKVRYRGQAWKSVHLPLFKVIEILESHADIEQASEITDWSQIDRVFSAVKAARDFYFDKKKISYPIRQKLKGSNPPQGYNLEEKYESDPESPATGVKDQPDVALNIKS